jgi:hypothetical protein
VGDRRRTRGPRGLRGRERKRVYRVWIVCILRLNLTEVWAVFHLVEVLHVRYWCRIQAI